MRRAYTHILASMLVVGAAVQVQADPAELTEQFRVNSYGTGEQLSSAVCADAAGNFVVVFQDGYTVSGLDGDYGGIRARQVTAAGTPLGFMEFAVNQYTTDQQRDPKVACSANGDFVVVWGSGYYADSPDESGEAIAARRFNADGTPKGTEFVVNSTTEYSQSDADVCSSAAGDFVVVWSGPYYHVYGQRFDDQGDADGTEFQVDLSLVEYAFDPAVACDEQGNFIVVWNSTQNDGDVLGMRYAADGLPLGTQFEVNSYTTGSQGTDFSGYQEPLDVAAAPDGRFVVVWQDAYEFDNYAIVGRRFNADGSAAGADFQVSQPSAGGYYSYDYPNVDVSAAMSNTGHFAVAWAQFDDFSSSYMIQQRHFDPQGTADGDEIRISASPDGNGQADIGAASSGNFVTTWTAYNSQTDSNDIFSVSHGATMCGAAPATGCRNTPPGETKLQIKDNADDPRKDQLKFNWKKGDATPIEALGNPVTGPSRYEICLYDSSAEAQPLYKGLVPPNAGVFGSSEWQTAGSTGFRFSNKYEGNGSGGVTKLKVKAGDTGKSRVQVQARGTYLPVDHDHYVNLSVLPLVTPVTVQVLADSGSGIECWQTVFTTSDESTPTKFKAEGP